MVLVKHCLSLGKRFYLNYECDQKTDYVSKGPLGSFILIDIMKIMKITGIPKTKDKNMINKKNTIYKVYQSGKKLHLIKVYFLNTLLILILLMNKTGDWNDKWLVYPGTMCNEAQ